MLNQQLKPLYNRYRSELKPLIAEYESRNENFVTPLLNDIPAMFDNIAMYEKASTTEDKEEYRIDAEKCLDTAIGNLRVCLVASMMKDVNQFKSRFSQKILDTLDNGNFCGRFFRLEKEVRAVKDTDLQAAYLKLKEMEDMIAKCHAGTLATGLLSDNKPTTVFKWFFTIAIALIINFLILKYF